ncbi:MAG: DUF5678 domain-containing protein [Elusimicrobiota bacterium]
MKHLSYIQLQEKYGGKFIATLKGKVVASEKTTDKLFKQVKEKLGDKNLTIEYIEPKGRICVY